MDIKEMIVHMVNAEGFWYGIFVMCVFYAVAMLICGIKSAIENAAEERAKKARREERLRMALRKRKFVNFDLSKNPVWTNPICEVHMDTEGLEPAVKRRSEYAKVS